MRDDRPVMVALRALIAILGGAAMLVGCSSLFSRDTENAWRAQAESACMAQHRPHRSPYVERLSRLRDRGACGIHQPLKVSAGLGGMIAYSRPPTINCPMTTALDAWFWNIVQPSALKIFGSPVVEVRTMGGYNCRTRNNRRGARLSEHSFGNAVDLAAFTLSNGREVTVLNGWRGAPDESVFLREVHRGACNVFTTVIGPDGDRFHQDHFHLDLARHNRDGTYRHCR